MLTDQQDAYGHMLLDHPAGMPAREIIERNDGFFSVGPGAELYFSSHAEWRPSSQEALKHARGRVLDVGCGAGRHSLYLQSQGCDVLGTDISPGAIRVSRTRGLRQATVLPVTSISSRLGRFDTILMLGNNFGLFATPKRARWLLRRFHRATPRDGRILAGSIDPRRTDNPDHLAYHERNLARGRLPGELRIRVRYRKFVTPWFGLLLVSRDEISGILEGTGWRVSRFLSDGGPSYVAVIEKQPVSDVLLC
jgi:SAM-dependent methyltransferase